MSASTMPGAAIPPSGVSTESRRHTASVGVNQRQKLSKGITSSAVEVTMSAISGFSTLARAEAEHE